MARVAALTLQISRFILPLKNRLHAATIISEHAGPTEYGDRVKMQEDELKSLETKVERLHATRITLQPRSRPGRLRNCRMKTPPCAPNRTSS